MANSKSTATPSMVVKIGGSILGNEDTTLEDLVALQKRGATPVVVHGGGQVISDWMGKVGAQPQFVRGLRVTDAASMEIVSAVLCGLINKELVSSIQSLGGKAIGMSGVDGSMLQGRILDPDLGYVGQVVSVDTGPILGALAAGYMPVIAPVAVHLADSSEHSGVLLNVNGDTAAGEIARALNAESMVFLTDVEGVLNTDQSLISSLTTEEGQALIQAGTVAGGMVPKMEACLRALEGVRVAQISDGRKSRALLDFMDGNSSGTRIGGS